MFPEDVPGFARLEHDDIISRLAASDIIAMVLPRLKGILLSVFRFNDGRMGVIIVLRKMIRQMNCKVLSDKIAHNGRARDQLPAVFSRHSCVSRR